MEANFPEETEGNCIQHLLEHLTLNKAWWPGPGEGVALGSHREPQASSRA